MERLMVTMAVLFLMAAVVVFLYWLVDRKMHKVDQLIKAGKEKLDAEMEELNNLPAEIAKTLFGVGDIVKLVRYGVMTTQFEKDVDKGGLWEIIEIKVDRLTGDPGFTVVRYDNDEENGTHYVTAGQMKLFMPCSERACGGAVSSCECQVCQNEAELPKPKKAKKAKATKKPRRSKATK